MFAQPSSAQPCSMGGGPRLAQALLLVAVAAETACFVVRVPSVRGRPCAVERRGACALRAASRQEPGREGPGEGAGGGCALCPAIHTHRVRSTVTRLCAPMCAHI